MTAPTTREMIEESLAWRYATKVFDSTKKISANDWSTLELSLQTAPSSFGLQPWHFVVITDPELRATLRPHSWNQPQIVDASHLVVIAAKTSMDEAYVDAFIDQTAQARGQATESLAPYRGMMVDFIAQLSRAGTLESWATHQAYLALGMLLSTAAFMKIDACPLEGIDRAKYDSILELPKHGYSSKVACALGYRSADDQLALREKIRFPRDTVFSYRG